MSQKASVQIIILVVLTLISLSLASGGFYLFQKERTKNLQLQEQLEEINTKQKITERKLEESRKIISDLQLKLQDAKNQIDKLGNDLQQEKTARLEALANIEQLKVDLELQKESRFDLEKKLNQAQEDVIKTQAKLRELDAQRVELELKIKDLEAKSQDVELGKIVVSPETVPPPKSKEKKDKAVQPTSEKEQESAQVLALEGKVLVINKDYNFVIINLGSKDGVSLDEVFSVYHNNKYLGDVKVEKLHESMAAAGFVSSNIKDKISEGDKVVRKVK